MKTKLLYLVLCAVSALSTFLPGHAQAGDCKQCHTQNGITVKIPVIQPIKVITDGKERSITLKDSFSFHGHECPGMTTTFLGIRYGIQLLYHGAVPDSSDLLITARTPAGGVKDLIDLVMKGNNPADRTWAPSGMKNDQDRFNFTIIRKSTSEAVDVRLNPALLPDSFSKLQQKQKNKKTTPQEDEQLHSYIKNIITGFPLKPAEELFGTPKPYKLLLWGTVQDSEMDRHIRKMRQAEKKKQLQG